MKSKYLKKWLDEISNKWHTKEITHKMVEAIPVTGFQHYDTLYLVIRPILYSEPELYELLIYVLNQQNLGKAIPHYIMKGTKETILNALTSPEIYQDIQACTILFDDAKYHKQAKGSIGILLDDYFFEDFEGIVTFHFPDKPEMRLNAGIFTSEMGDAMNDFYVGDKCFVVLDNDTPMELHLEAIRPIDDSIKDSIHIIETSLIDKVAIRGTFYVEQGDYYIKSIALPCPLELEYNDKLCDTMKIGERYEVIGGLWLYVYEWQQYI